MALFQEIIYNKQLVKNWNCFKINNDNRLYYTPIDSNEKRGFHFVLMSFGSCLPGSGDYWENPNSELDVYPELYGTAYFDGLRHVFSNSCSHENDLDKLIPNGYVYYQNSQIMIKVYEKIHELEKEYCSDPPKFSDTI